MSRIRVVLYAEGAGETGGETRQLPPPGNVLSSDLLGPGHLLLRRCILEGLDDIDGEVLFEAPLKTGRGQTARGSMLLKEKTLRQLLTWLDPEMRPDLAVVLVDQDEDNKRKSRLEKYMTRLPSMPILSVAVQEFESWLVADHSCVAEILDHNIQPPRNPENMRRREAKQLLKGWIKQSGTALEDDEVRRRIARQCDLATVARTCRAFDVFLKDLIDGTRSKTGQ